MWAPRGADGASGATDYQRGSKDLLEVVGFVLGKGKREDEKEVKIVKRMLMVLALALIVGTIMAISAATGFAAERCRGEVIKPNQTCVKGGGPPAVENRGGNQPAGQQPSPGNSGR